MDVIYSLIPGMMVFGLIFFAVLIWAVKKGQYEDMEGNASRILLDDDEEMMDYPEETTDKTNSHLTKLHKPQQVNGYSHSTGETTSHSTRLPSGVRRDGRLYAQLAKDSNQVAGYRLSAEELLAGHPKDDSQVHPQGVRRGCEGLTPQQHTQAGYDDSKGGKVDKGNSELK